MWYVGGIQIDSRNYGLVFTSLFFTSLAFLIVSLRMSARAFLVRNVGADDILICLAVVGRERRHSPPARGVMHCPNRRRLQLASCVFTATNIWRASPQAS